MLAKPRPLDGPSEALSIAAGLDTAYGNLSPAAVIERAIGSFAPGEIAAVSSFGADSAVLLHIIAEVDRDLPIIFLDTGKHFGETLDYRDALAADFGLRNIRVLTPDASTLSALDPAGNLHLSDTESAASSGVRTRMLRRPKSAASASR